MHSGGLQVSHTAVRKRKIVLHWLRRKWERGQKLAYMHSHKVILWAKAHFCPSFSSCWLTGPLDFPWKEAKLRNKWSFSYWGKATKCRWCLWYWVVCFPQCVRSLTYHRRVSWTHPQPPWWSRKLDGRGAVRPSQKWWVWGRKQSKTVYGFWIAWALLRSSWTLWVGVGRRSSRTKIYLKSWKQQIRFKRLLLARSPPTHTGRLGCTSSRFRFRRTGRSATLALSGKSPTETRLAGIINAQLCFGTGCGAWSSKLSPLRSRTGKWSRWSGHPPAR